MLRCVAPPWTEEADARIELTLNGDPQPPAVTQLGLGYYLCEQKGRRGRPALMRPKRLIGRGWPRLGAA